MSRYFDRSAKTALAAILFAAYVTVVGQALQHSGVRGRQEISVPDDGVIGPSVINSFPVSQDDDLNREFNDLSVGSDPHDRDLDELLSAVPGTTDGAGRAARFAAEQANAECFRLWRHTPFLPEQYPAHFRDGLWSWGEYDPLGRDGFSAEVSFQPDGTGVRLQINFSVDTLDVSK